MYNKILQIGNIRTDRETFPNPQSTRIYSPKGLAPTFTLVYAPLILVKENGEYVVRETTGVEEMRLIGVEFDDVQKALPVFGASVVYLIGVCPVVVVAMKGLETSEVVVIVGTYVIRHEIDDYLKSRFVSALDQAPELCHTCRRLVCEIGVYVVVVADGVG